MASDDDEERIAELLAQALDDMDAGRDVDLQALCKDHPEHLEQVASALGLRDDLASLRQQAEQAPSNTGKLLADRYLLLSAIGSGAAGTVYLAEDQRLQREVAVKLLHRGLFDGGDAETRFHREAVVLAAHEHEHIVRIYDQGHTETGESYLVTELLRGCSLHDVLTNAQHALTDGPSMQAFANMSHLRELLPNARLESSWLRQAVLWVAQLGEGLIAAHEADVCHRDIKPSNAWVRDDGNAVLLDFGIATRLGEASITHTHTVLGTPSYMAPEQAAGQSDARPALDIYGLTATLYHLLTLRPPHAGDLQQVMVSLRMEDPVPAQKLCRGLPRDLQAILDRGLERNPHGRYQTMRELVRDLRAFLDHAPVSARPLGRVRRSWRRIVRRPAKALAVTATAAAVLIAGIALPAWWTVTANAAEAARGEKMARLPADICIEGWPDMRPLVPVDEQGNLLAELDELLELDDRDIGMRLLRGASMLDFGRLADARRDFEAIEQLAPTDYVRELARRVANAKQNESGRYVVDFADLPAPSSTNDHFLAGFFALRNRDANLAKRLLGEAEDYLPARDLRLLTLLASRPLDPHLAIREASKLEAIYGRETARTQHTLAVAHLQLKEYEKAIPFCERSLAIRPERHGPWTNLGFANLRLGRLDEARRCYQRAVEIRRWLPNSLSGLSQTLRALGRYDEAHEVAAQIRDEGWRAYELAGVEVHRAFQCQYEGDRDGQRTAAQAAVAHYRTAIADEHTTNPKKGREKIGLLLAMRLAENQLQLALVPQLAAMRGDPRNARQIANLAGLLRAPLDDDARGRLRLWLLDLTVDLAPDNPEYQQMRKNLLHELRSR